MIRRNASFAVIATAAALLLLAGCGTYQDVNGYGYPQQQPYAKTIHGTVDYVDTASRSIVLYNTSGYGTMLSGSGYPANGGSLRVDYDNRTSVSWQGRNYRPEDLQRGDQVDLTVYQSGNQLIAQSANVTYNASATNNPYPDNSYPNNSYPNQSPNQYPNQSSLIRGTVRSINTNSRTITIDSNNTVYTVSYDTGVRVDVNGQLYPVTNLERGDMVDVQTQGDRNGNNLFASRITLIRDVRR